MLIILVIMVGTITGNPKNFRTCLHISFIEQDADCTFFQLSFLQGKKMPDSNLHFKCT